MRAVLAHSIKSVNPIQTKFGLKYLAKIQIHGEAEKEFWLSIKQAEKLIKAFDSITKNGGYSTKKAECHIIIDDGEKGERFVWCGIHSPGFSELKVLEEKFSVKFDSPYIGRYDLVFEKPIEADEYLKD